MNNDFNLTLLPLIILKMVKFEKTKNEEIKAL